MLQRALSLIAVISLLPACAVGPAVDARSPCEAEAFTLQDDFVGARRGRCVAMPGNNLRITILPENDGYINNSPWYAFKVVPKADADATITMNYVGGNHRYEPKISFDGIHWQRLGAEHVEVSDDRETATLRIRTGDKAFWIAGQELITPRMYDVWSQKIASTGVVSATVLGDSRGGQPITLLSSNADASDVLLLVGRQHPPEVTGAIGFFAFYEALMADSELAEAFRARFHVAAIPMLNPDGVAGGNWRHNLGATDLNRDWGTFKQPETKLVDNLLRQYEKEGKQIRVFLDFHSTQKNVFYTQDDDSPTVPPHFTRRWLDNAKPRIENYEFDYEENPTENLGVAKNHIYTRYGIPSSTYEVGDETDRAAIRAAAKVFAEELMEIMLAEF